MSVYTGYSKSSYYLTASENPFTNEGTIIGDNQAALVANQVPVALITNLGNLLGGTDSAGIILNSGTVNNDYDVVGGSGNSSGYRIFFGYYTAGRGGDGVTASGFARINNSDVIAGSSGGFANYTYSYRGSPLYDGGNGGAGLNLEAGGEVVNSGLIEGGQGGGAFEDSEGRNGAGGAGITMSGFGRITNTGDILGGNTQGLHGKGGDGVDLSAGGTLIDSGLIEGGSNSGGIGGTGVALGAGGSVTIEQGGFIKGGQSAPNSESAGVILDGGTLATAGTIAGGSSTSDSVLFVGSAPARMSVSDGASFQGAIGGFRYGDTIDLTNLAPSYVESHFNPTTDTITTVDGTMQFAGDPTLLFSTDADGGTLVTTPCFRRGTMILTESGERPIETLEIGDRVLTKGRELKPIRWIGRRHYAGARLLGSREVLPVLIRAGALGDQLPRRDLWVSPEHALYLNGALVPASLLTNGISVLTDSSVRSVTYYHLEFDQQELIFAEGAPAESFVDDDSRKMFDNAADYARRYPAAPHQSATFCAPRLEDGEALEVLRSQLAAVAGIAVPALVGASTGLELRA